MIRAKDDKKNSEEKQEKKRKRAAENEAGTAPARGEEVEEKASGPDGAPAETEQEEAPAAEQRIRELEQQVAELKDRYLRALAEFDNYRKRMQRELNDVRLRERLETVREFLTVFDHFEMAMAHAEESPDLDTLKQGMQMILNEFRKALENLGVERFDATGEEFSPELHEAVGQEASRDVPAGRVVRQWKSGYRMGEKLLRPAAVVVSTGADDETESNEDHDSGNTADA